MLLKQREEQNWGPSQADDGEGKCFGSPLSSSDQIPAVWMALRLAIISVWSMNFVSGTGGWNSRGGVAVECPSSVSIVFGLRPLRPRFGLASSCIG